jgi:hypothetical protein
MGILIFGTLPARSSVCLHESASLLASAPGAPIAVRSVGAVGFATAGFRVSVGPSFVPSSWGLVISRLDVRSAMSQMNLQGAVNERGARTLVMPVFHAFFSFGTVIGAALGPRPKPSSSPSRRTC